MDLLDDTTGSNAHDYTVSEISGAVKRVIEGEFGRVRVRGEVGRVSRPGSGHLYFDLKDDRSVIAAVSWKGQVARMAVRPEEGMEVIATGKLTTFPGQSKYQLIVDEVEPAGAGALMAMLEARRRALAAEGLFEAGRKQPIPFLPDVIGVVTSPSGAVIRDILHRLRDRFPRRVLIWPVAVQGQACAPEVTAAIRGFNALAPGGAVPRPDLIIVARGGGSLEDLWGFNEESVVRAAAESAIPLISAVGHETDTTLIDFAADRRAPTPTAAAEMAVPVRAELAARLAEAEARMARAARGRIERGGQRMADLSRALGRPEALIAPARQRFDLMSDRLAPALRMVSTRKRAAFAPLAALIGPQILARFMRHERDRLTGLSGRLAPALARNRAEAARMNARNRAALEGLAERLARAPEARLAALAERLARLDRMRQTLGYTETLRRGYAVVRGAPGLITARAQAAAAGALEIEFHDGRIGAQTTESLPPPPAATPAPEASPAPKTARAKPPRKDTPPEQGSLF